MHVGSGYTRCDPMTIRRALNIVGLTVVALVVSFAIFGAVMAKIALDYPHLILSAEEIAQGKQQIEARRAADRQIDEARRQQQQKQEP